MKNRGDINALVSGGEVQRMSSTLPKPGSTDVIVPLPDGFRPVGIAHGRGTTAYVGSSASGAIYAVDLGTRRGDLLVAEQRRQVTHGLAYDARTGYLFAAGGATGNGLVLDTRTGELLQDVQLTTDPAGLVLDVTLTAEAAWFSDGGRPCLYRVALGPDGRLAMPVRSAEHRLGAAYAFVEGDLNASGIVAVAGGQSLLIVHTALGLLYRFDPSSGAVTPIDLGGATLPDSSGLALDGTTLYVANFNNQVFVVELDPAMVNGTMQGSVTSRTFDNPSAVVANDNQLCVVSARVATDPLPTTPYWLTSLRFR